MKENKKERRKNEKNSSLLKKTKCLSWAQIPKQSQPPFIGATTRALAEIRPLLNATGLCSGPISQGVSLLNHHR